MHNPILKHAKDLQSILIKSKTQSNSAFYLLENNARTSLFMLQSIMRVLDKKDEGTFEKWLKNSKKLEDSLGEIDHYNAFILGNPKTNYFSKEALKDIVNKFNKANEKFNKKLVKKDFYLDWIDALLSTKLDFSTDSYKNFIKELCIKELNKSSDFFNASPMHFTDMELQVHELRRKLRWISIYAQSFDGLFAYKASRAVFKWEKEFITKHELTSQFNALPKSKFVKEPILLNKKAFYALSSVIRQIGAIKDQGLKIHAKKITVTELNLKVSLVEKKKIETEERELLNKAHSLLKSFFVVHKIHTLIIEK